MEIFQTILLIIYIVSFIYYMIELGSEMLDWYRYGAHDVLFYKTIILSFICGIIPIVNTVFSIIIFINKLRLKKD